jgi:hypothetical protein
MLHGVPRLDVADLRGWGRLACDATLGLTGVVEAMHDTIWRARPMLGAPAPGRTRGITGFVYGNVRGVTRVVGWSVDAGLARLAQAPAGRAPSAKREAVVSMLNGVVGDHLAATGNPLAIPMTLRRDGRALALERSALAAAIPDAGRRVVVLVHGACMSDLRWLRSGHDHGAALARDLGLTPIYLHYNTGLHVSTNGRRLAETLESLARAWPVPLEELVVLAHSMGGLVARSACQAGAEAGHQWVPRLRSVVFLGTPHHGAPLERGGNLVDAMLGLSPYGAPIARLGKVRSAGITDLRHGSLVDADWDGRDRFAFARARPRHVPLPGGVSWHAVAGATARAGRVLGDGLVPVNSALGEHRDPDRCLAIPEASRWVARGVNHFELLSNPDVYERIRSWLGAGAVAPGARKRRSRASARKGRP